MALIGQKERNIDIVFCIDGTGSMGPCIKQVKESAARFQQEFANEMMKLGSIITSMRVKVIVFRDYGCDSKPMVESRFFELPDDEAEYSEFLANEVQPIGGGDDDENSLEALYTAMKSDFVTGSNDRQVIVLFTDADALPLGERAISSAYPSDMVKDMKELVAVWTNPSQGSGIKIMQRTKRLLIYAPATKDDSGTPTVFEEVAKALDRSQYIPVNLMSGLEDINFEEVIKQIAASASK